MTWTPDPSIIITAEQKAAALQEQTRTALWAERDRRFEETRWLVERHSEELLLGRPTSLSASEYAELLAYRQDLRDLPESTEIPVRLSGRSDPDEK
ncbi:MAG TPA: hypothetical protein VNS12_14845 [Pelagibacterium sp.]|uniref:hypothetical protein n=1 Tax=Pelagibacterium sp. TaxID=1967288 RepID=UPI002C96139C|nr:hypothetical protein [Pelagibacterium sp.]HWJ89342.1 hypothetical protein [Pelagibacterium sp.]